MYSAQPCLGNCTCECCSGTQVATPALIFNRPGLDRIFYRIGEHGSFLETMKARLSSSDFPALEGLTARTSDDLSIALLDSWAMVADVLTFYQERIANEGYLRTAIERRSVLELARLVGYEPRPGVSATVYLAYTVDENAEKPVEIAAGARVQSVPGPGELPQAFETSEKLIARKEWNAIKPRLHRPQTLQSILEGSDQYPGMRLYLAGTNTNVKVNDGMLLDPGTGHPALYRVTGVTTNDAGTGYTLVGLAPWLRTTAAQVTVETMLRRALQRHLQSSRVAAAGFTVPGQLLSIAGDFLTWLQQQSVADPLPDDLKKVFSQPDVVEMILRPFDALRQAAIASLPSGRLAAGALAAANDIDKIGAAIRESTGIEGGGSIGAQAATAAAAVRTAIKDRTPEIIDEQQDIHIANVMRTIVGQLSIAGSVPPRSSQSLERSPGLLFDRNSDVGMRAVMALQPSIADTLVKAAANAEVTSANPVRAYVLRQRSLLFGATAPKKIIDISDKGVVTSGEWSDDDILAEEETEAICLDGSYDKLKPGSWVVMDFTAAPSDLGKIKLAQGLLIARAGDVNSKMARAAYGFSGQTSRVYLLDADGNPLSWMKPANGNPLKPAVDHSDATPAFALLRRAAVYFDSEELTLADEPIETEICGGDQLIETDQLLTGLESGRWLIVSGERSDIPATAGVRASELVMLQAVRQYAEKIPPFPASEGSAGTPASERVRAQTFLPGDRLHTYLRLARPLSYCYRRGTVSICANVIKATHGETRSEILGSGDGSAALQTFALKSPPLTFVPSPEPDGIKSTLRVYVNNVEWHEAEALLEMEPSDRSFISRTGDEGVTSVGFGNGIRGARLPTGVENVKAVYRSGLGAGGNVGAGQISQLLTRPLGVKGVVNPLPASGGADRESRDSARRNAPMAVKSLGRLVSPQDYADFARTFAGIGKALSARVVAGGSECVFVTVAGCDDIPIDKSSDLYANLVTALRAYGDPYQPFLVQMRELLMLALNARVAIDPDYLWDDVVDRMRAKLLDVFSFERRELGQSIALSEVIAVIQRVKGVVSVDIEAFGAVSQLNAQGQRRAPQEIATAFRTIFEDSVKKARPAQLVRVAGIRGNRGNPLPAQIAFFVPQISEAVVLTRVEA